MEIFFRTAESLRAVILFVSFEVEMFALVTGNELPVLSGAALCTDLALTDPEDQWVLRRFSCWCNLLEARRMLSSRPVERSLLQK